MITDGAIYELEDIDRPLYAEHKVTAETFDQEVELGIWYLVPYRPTGILNKLIFRYYRPNGALIERNDIPITVDGFSPKINLEEIEGGTRISIKDIIGQKHFDIYDGDDGKPLRNRGAWAPYTDYVVNDFVNIEGSSYACIETHRSSSSFDSSKWTLMAQVGDDATQYYIHQVYCDDLTTGANYSTTESRYYIGIYVDTTERDAASFEEADAKDHIVWSRIQGKDGGYQDYLFAVGAFDLSDTELRDLTWYDAPPPTTTSSPCLYMATKWITGE